MCPTMGVSDGTQIDLVPLLAHHGRHRLDFKEGKWMIPAVEKRWSGVG